jgi:hypothetical protein
MDFVPVNKRKLKSGWLHFCMTAKFCSQSRIMFCFLTLTDSNFSAISWQEQVNFQWDSSLDWPNRGSNPWSTALEASMLTITPPMRLSLSLSICV